MDTSLKSRFSREITEEGRVIIRNKANGEVVAEYDDPVSKIEVPLDELAIARVNDKSIVRVEITDGRKVWVQKGVNLDKIPVKRWEFSEWYQNNICDMVTRGLTLNEICAIEGFPPRKTIFQWQRENAEFREAMAQAREMFADHCYDEIAAIARGVKKKSEVAASKLKIQAMKWLAEKGNSKKYGQTMVHKGDADNPVTFVINTGINRQPLEHKKDKKTDPEDEAIEVEASVVGG